MRPPTVIALGIVALAFASGHADALTCYVILDRNDAVLYQDEVASAEALRQSVWLELRSDEPARLCQQIIEFGVTKIEIPGAEHLYFQAPGGQVFRVVKNGEDLSRFEQ